MEKRKEKKDGNTSHRIDFDYLYEIVKRMMCYFSVFSFIVLFSFSFSFDFTFSLNTHADDFLFRFSGF